MPLRNTKNYSPDPLHVHDSVKGCAICWPIYRAEINTRSYNKMAGDDTRYAKSLEYKRSWKKKDFAKKVLLCASCGEPREYNRTYCNACRKAFRDFTQTKNFNKRVKEGRVDFKAKYQKRIERQGRAHLNELARAAYQRRKLRLSKKKAMYEEQKRYRDKVKLRKAA